MSRWAPTYEAGACQTRSPGTSPRLKPGPSLTLISLLTLTLTLTLPCAGYRSEFAARTNVVRKPGATDITKTVRMLPGRVLK